MLQGDSYYLDFEIEKDGMTIIPEDVDAVEISIGKLTKNGIYANGLWRFPLSQEETFAMRGNEPVQVRMLFKTGDVIGEDCGVISVAESISKVIL